ncbi:MAG: hypothetical protein ACOY3I_02290 [Verrucomicrobiota bacterium]
MFSVVKKFSKSALHAVGGTSHWNIMDLIREHSAREPLDYSKDIRKLYGMEKITRLSRGVSKKSQWANVPTTAREYEVYPIQFPFGSYLRRLEKQKPRDQIKICDFASGISNFGMKMNQRGYKVFSVDPILAHLDDPRMKIMIEQNPEVIADIQKEPRYGKYCAGISPELPFAPQTFDMTFCSNLAFAHSDQGLEFHKKLFESLTEVTSHILFVYPLFDYGHQHAEAASKVVSLLNAMVKNPARRGILHKRVSPHVDPIYEIYSAPDSKFKPAFYETIDGEFGMMLTRDNLTSVWV